MAANARRTALRGLRAADGALAADAGGLDVYGALGDDDERIFPFELECLEGALMVATGAACCAGQGRAGGLRAGHARGAVLPGDRGPLCCCGSFRRRRRCRPARIPLPPFARPCPPLPAGKLDAELVAATRRVSSMLQKLPREITPVNLEELRRVKQMLVELESKAENMR